MNDVDSMVAADIAHVVHPLTLLGGKTAEAVTMVAEGQGIYIRDTNGREYIDACSGMWNVNVGYGRAELAEAAAKELGSLGYGTLYLNRGNLPAARLAAKLAEVVPGNIERFFFSMGGSDANETAIKLARCFNSMRGKPHKYRVIAREHGYHGSSLGAMSATGNGEFWAHFGPRLPGFSHVHQPRPGDANAAEEVEAEILRLGPDNVAAFIAEPICLPAGVAIPPATYWSSVRDICSRHDVLLIADEVVTGFGRTGRFFGLEHWDVVPDLLVLAKGMTSGYLPLGAVGMSDAFYEAICEPERAFMHGFTASGHPACCAVALRNIKIIEDEALVENARVVGAHLENRLRSLPLIDTFATSVRALGMLAAVDLRLEGGTRGSGFASGDTGKAVEVGLRERGVLVRAFGDTIALAPPLITSIAQIDEIADKLTDALLAVSRRAAAPRSVT